MNGIEILIHSGFVGFIGYIVLGCILYSFSNKKIFLSASCICWLLSIVQLGSCISYFAVFTEYAFYEANATTERILDNMEFTKAVQLCEFLKDSIPNIDLLKEVR